MEAMKITWYGHAAFAIEGRNSQGRMKKVILDPYNYPGCGGYLPIDEPADVVCVSHDNRKYHSDIAAVVGEPEVLRALEFAGGAREASGIRFESKQVFENAAGEGPNAMVKLTLSGICAAHIGDLGHPADAAALDFLRGAQVLLALAGGAPTIALADLVELIEEVRPAVVIPMHFKTPKVNLNILPVDHFLRQASAYPIHRVGSSELLLRSESLPQEPTLYILEHAR